MDYKIKLCEEKFLEF